MFYLFYITVCVLFLELSANEDNTPYKTYTQDLISCKPKRIPDVYGNISSMKPFTIKPCVLIEMNGLLSMNRAIGKLAHRPMSDTVEVVLLTEVRGGVHYLEVTTDGDYSFFDISNAPKRTFRQHSCLNRDSFCSVTAALPIQEGFFTLDRHRLLRFNFTWLPDISVLDSELFDKVVSSFGNFNVAISEQSGENVDNSLLFPSDMVEFGPDNVTHMDDIEITPYYAQTYAAAKKGETPRLLFVADTGNHRIVMLDIAHEAKIEYMGQFGRTGIARTDSAGLNWPAGVALRYPGVSSLYRREVANLFVTDQLNNRLVKLDLIDLESGFELQWGGSYGTEDLVKGGHRGLSSPSGVSTFRHYIIVAEAYGNSITILMVNYLEPTKFVFVTQMQPAPGMKLAGPISVSEKGYVWYTYTKHPLVYAMGTMYLPEALHESVPPTLKKDILELCVNETYYNTVVRFDPPLFYKTFTNMLSAKQINWRFEYWRSPYLPEGSGFGYVDYQSFNLTRFGTIDFDLMNRSIFEGAMVFCKPPPPPTAPPMSSNEGGIGGTGVSASVLLTGASHRCTLSGATALLWMVAALIAPAST